MDTARYYKLEELPEPDYFEIELEKIYQPPPTPFERAKRWVRRYWILVGLVALFLVAAVLYAGFDLASRPRLMGIKRPETALLKELADVPAQATVTVEDDAVVSTDGQTVTVDVAGSDVNVGNTTVDVDAGKLVLDLSDTKNATQSDAGGSSIIAAEGAAKNTTTTTSGSSSSSSNSNNPDKPTALQDDGQVSIHDAPPTQATKPPPPPPATNSNNKNEPYTPIKATFYSGVEGPKSCRGHAIAVIDMPKAPQGSPLVPTAPACYNFPNRATSGCATLAANKDDGCIAQVFAETNCRVFMNTAAFMAENRPVGGNWRSVRVQCGIPEPDPATLGKPPMMDAITHLQDNDKAKGGGG